MDWKERLQRILAKPPLLDERMEPYTSFCIGGPAEAMVFPQTVEELQLTLQCAQEFNLPVFILGRGTNLLVKDEGLSGIVLNLTDLCSGCFFEETSVKAGSAMSLKSLVTRSVNKGLKGLEFASGIPGSLGGAIFMNAGAYGSNIGERVVEVELLDFEGNRFIHSREEMSFSYRWSSLQEKKAIILNATLQLEKGNKEALKEIVKAVNEKRRARHPTLPSAGSIFRNPPGQPAGYLVEKAGAKGMRVGGAMVSPLHGNFIVNTGGATAKDVLCLIDKVKKKVSEEMDIELELEVEIVGKQQVD